MRYEIGRILKKEKVMELVSGYCAEPKSLLGRHLTEKGQMIAAYHPKAVKMWLLTEDRERLEMEMVERQPVFALFLPHQKDFFYQIEIELADGLKRSYYDPYSFPSQISREEELAFARGEWLDAYRKLGCHPMTIHGVEGMYFAVWAPHTRSVYLSGDFNKWDRKLCPMNRRPDSDIYEIFIPGVAEGMRYRYEPRTCQDKVWKASDSYGIALASKKKYASKILNLNDFEWDDEEWMERRKDFHEGNRPVIICNYSEEQDGIMESALEDLFTHVLVRTGKSSGEMLKAAYVGERGFFVPPICASAPHKFQKFVRDAHKQGIGVLMEMFYEDFNYDRPQTMSYMLSNLLFWIREYHVDGFVFESASDTQDKRRSIFTNMDIINEILGSRSMPGEEQRKALMYKAVKLIRREAPGALIIANERKNKKDDDPEELLLGKEIDYFWNTEIGKSLDGYFAASAEDRRREHFNLTLPLQKGNLGRSLLLLEYKEMNCLYQTAIDKRTEVYYDRLSEAKLFFTFLMGVPGKKILPDYDAQSRASVYLHSLLEMYRDYPALHESGEDGRVFEWVNGMDARSAVFSFIRKAESDSRRLLFLCNFSRETQEHYSVGVPVCGEYRLVSSSDEERFGGMNRFVEQRPHSVDEPKDFRPYSISVTLPPETALIFEYEDGQTAEGYIAAEQIQ